MWQSEMAEILRVMVDDMDGKVYAADKLERVLVVAAFQVSREMTFSFTYSSRIEQKDISPDPTDTATRDDSFINLVCLKGACIINRGSAVTAARRAISFRDGGSSADLRGVFQGNLALLEKGWCAVYLQEKLEYEAGRSRVAGAAIMTPFRLWSFGGYSDPRGRQTLAW